MYKWFLTVRYLVRRRIAYFSVLAVALAVAMVIVVYSVMSGFLGLMEGNVRNLSGDIIVENDGLESFPLYDEFIAIQTTHADMPFAQVQLALFLADRGKVSEAEKAVPV